MDSWDAITARRQVRDFADQPIAEATLHQILEAARRAPSARNGQPWDLVVVSNKAQLRRLAGVWRGAGWIPASAVTVALVVPIAEDDRGRLMTRFDAGQLATQLTIAATGLGVASGQAACADQALAQQILGFPDGHECVLLIALGYPKTRPLVPIVRPDRRAFDDVVHFERW